MSGIVRKLDPQRRLVVPQETLARAGIKAGDLLEVWSDLDESGNPCVVLALYRPGCVICRSTTVGHTFEDGKVICPDCIKKLQSQQSQGDEQVAKED